MFGVTYGKKGRIQGKEKGAATPRSGMEDYKTNALEKTVKG